MSLLRWRHCQDFCHGYYWYCGPLPNGWTAGVSDHSQSYTPRHRTTYNFSAISRSRFISGGVADTFAAAKREALLFAMKQEPVVDGERSLLIGGGM